jgi:NAD(P)-dependent dehydrogenase (short-subunit alcohol dehydrogenase family)
MCARDAVALQRASEEIGGKYWVGVLGLAADILDAHAMREFIERVGDRFGRIDILVNNAGGSEQRQASGSRQQVYAVDPLGGSPLPPGRFEEMSDAEYLARGWPRVGRRRRPSRTRRTGGRRPGGRGLFVKIPR